MDRLEKNTPSNDEGFVKTIFPFDQEQKGDLMNITQYIILALIPLVLLLKSLREWIPDADENKGSLEITVELLLQAFIIFYAFYFIDRIIHYIPTYSGIPYPNIHVNVFVIPVIFVAATIHTKFSEKIEILWDRLCDLYTGDKKDDKKNTSQNTQVRVTQPLSQQYSTNPNMATVNAPQQLQSQQTNIKSQTTETNANQYAGPNFNNMYAGPDNPLVGASTPGVNPLMEPMAANDLLGGSFGSSF